MKRFYIEPLPKCNVNKLHGKLIVLEGSDGSGRTTQIAKIKNWLEGKGYAVVNCELARSQLVGPELELARRGNVLGPTTLSLFYATDFMDQFENVIIPALRAGFIVLADRYFYTLMARDLVRGADPKWVQNIYGVTLIPDLVFYLNVSPRRLIERRWQKADTMDYWESGMDMGLSRDWAISFLIYQQRLRKVFLKLQDKYGFIVVNGNKSIDSITHDIVTRIEKLLT
ncbi:MAG: thymidylate kinase [Candidatus Marinimicrobia bacterium]|jgi:dTMP kinase|nr:thymidylate kinase [Candidatus Neomarinimicrobiota bacterium]MCK9559400.1 thymidylate kinase [Candidatus Neomarinimicrobiota bacterium]MDD5062756.1 thymidylate kinase [Candidatus Neomarinimicrobiota bacterium]MDD5230418.1 thymidylate kinase [Candidatus Neomarinimicrobiota bacterium]MDD5541470.1 thymidylate kinase [Candidatus Neomarinimicrobiota bacterium]